MNKRMLEILIDKSNHMDNLQWDNYMVRREGYGHTWEVAGLSQVHDGRETASYFVLGKIANKIDQDMGVAILNELKQLQIRDPDDRLFGAFR